VGLSGGARAGIEPELSRQFRRIRLALVGEDPVPDSCRQPASAHDPDRERIDFPTIERAIQFNVRAASSSREKHMKRVPVPSR